MSGATNDPSGLESGRAEEMGAEMIDEEQQGDQAEGEGRRDDAANVEPAPEGGLGSPGTGGAAMAPEKLLELRELVSGLFERIGVEAEVEVRDVAEAVHCLVRTRPGPALEAVPPRQLFDAIQHLANRIVNRDLEGGKRIVVEHEAGGAGEAEPAMAGLAARLARAAIRMEQPLTIVPIHARDRKAIHVALAKIEGVECRSEGEGLLRRLIIEKK